MSHQYGSRDSPPWKAPFKTDKHNPLIRNTISLKPFELAQPEIYGPHSTETCFR